jgi:hypothetical protein
LAETSDAHELKCDLAADVICRFGTLRLRVNGFSMLPSMWPGDIACVSSVDRDAYRLGDVVLYARNGRLFVHRLVEMAGETAVTRGDALLDRDPPVDRAGRVRGSTCRAR